jgi:hypothetical protein
MGRSDGGRSITLTGMSRPELFRETLRCLVRNDLAGWDIVIRIEPSAISGRFIEIAGELLAGSSYRVEVNERRLGLALNPFAAIESAFAQGSALNLHIEEDFLLAPDATAMALWYQRNHRPNWLCLSLLAGPCGSMGMLSNPAYPDMLFETRVFNSIGFALRREEWEAHVRPVWPVKPVSGGVGVRGWRYAWGWDWAVYGALVANRNLVTVQPAFARANHNGPLGENILPDFLLVDWPDLPYEIRSHINCFDQHTGALRHRERLDRYLHRPLFLIALFRLKERLAHVKRRLRLRPTPLP